SALSRTATVTPFGLDDSHRRDSDGFEPINHVSERSNISQNTKHTKWASGSEKRSVWPTENTEHPEFRVAAGVPACRSEQSAEERRRRGEHWRAGGEVALAKPDAGLHVFDMSKARYIQAKQKWAEKQKA